MFSYWSIFFYGVLIYVVYTIFNLFRKEVIGLLYYKFVKGYNIDYYFPFIGVLKDGLFDKELKGASTETIFRIIRENPEKKYMLSNAMGHTLFILFGEEMIQQFFEHQLEYYKKMDLPNLARVFGNGILFALDPEWKKQRKVLSESFHFDSLKKMNPIVVQTIKEQFADLKAEKDLTNVHIMERFQMITGDVVCRTFFGMGFANNKVNGRPMTLELADFIMRASLQPLKSIYSWIFGEWVLRLGLTAEDRQVNETSEQFRRLARNTINERRQNPQKVCGEDSTRKDFLQVIFDHNEKHPEEKWSDELIIDQFMTFFIAGMDTTGHVLGMAAYYLIKHPECQKKIMDEWKTLNKNIDDISTDDLPNLKYLDAFWHETLRFAAPVPLLTPRIAKIDHKLGEIDVKAGTMVNIGIAGECFNTKNWDQPHEFRPERWLNPSTEKKRHSYAFLPFSGGPHNCIGKYLAAIEGKYIILFFLHHFEFEMSDPDYRLNMVMRFMREPAVPILLNMKAK